MIDDIWKDDKVKVFVAGLHVRYEGDHRIRYFKSREGAEKYQQELADDGEGKWGYLFINEEILND